MFSSLILGASIIVTDISNGVKTNVALPTEAQMQLKDVIEDNVDMEVSLDMASTVVSPINNDVTNEDPSGWGNALGSTWGNEESQNAWAQSGSWGDEIQQGQGTNDEAEINLRADTKWADSDPSWNRDLASLFSLLGPSVFPLTHMTGIVECSTRRVSAVHFPPNYPDGVPLPNLGRGEEAREGLHWTPSAFGVEVELDARFAKVVLEPWGRVEGDISGPEIWSTSRGSVIDPNNPSKVPTDTASIATRKPHNPLTDNITLLVQPSLAETLALVPGLGLGAMWIEIVRQESGAEAAASGGVAQETPARFWYHEDVTGIFPSFYTPQAME